MKNRIYTAFDTIKAEEKLKESTYAFLQKKAYRKRLTFSRLAAITASVFALFAAVIFSYNLYFVKAAFVDVDVNPSIELTLNRFDRVIGTYAYNDDGKKILSEINIKHKTYKEALQILIDKMVEKGYMDAAELFTATLQMKDGEDDTELLDSLKISIESILHSDGKVMEQEVFLVDSTTKEHSHEQNLTPAKYLAVLELREVDPTATFDGCRGHSISEIRQQAHDHMNGRHGQNNSDYSGGNNDDGDNNHGRTESSNGNNKKGNRHGNGH